MGNSRISGGFRSQYGKSVVAWPAEQKQNLDKKYLVHGTYSGNCIGAMTAGAVVFFLVTGLNWWCVLAQSYCICTQESWSSSSDLRRAWAAATCLSAGAVTVFSYRGNGSLQVLYLYPRIILDMGVACFEVCAFHNHHFICGQFPGKDILIVAGGLMLCIRLIVSNCCDLLNMIIAATWSKRLRSSLQTVLLLIIGGAELFWSWLLGYRKCR